MSPLSLWLLPLLTHASCNSGCQQCTTGCTSICSGCSGSQLPLFMLLDSSEDWDKLYPKCVDDFRTRSTCRCMSNNAFKREKCKEGEFCCGGCCRKKPCVNYYVFNANPTCHALGSSDSSSDSDEAVSPTGQQGRPGGQQGRPTGQQGPPGGQQGPPGRQQGPHGGQGFPGGQGPPEKKSGLPPVIIIGAACVFLLFCVGVVVFCAMQKSGGGGSFAGASFASNQSAQKARGGKHGYIGGVRKSKDSMQKHSSISAMRKSNDAMRKNFMVRNSKDPGQMRLTRSTNGAVMKTTDGQRPRINRGRELRGEMVVVRKS